MTSATVVQGLEAHGRPATAPRSRSSRSASASSTIRRFARGKPLSPRQREVVVLAAAGATNLQIAAAMKITSETSART
jgi:DNA-binding NarL/FixJ family response regulator